MAGGLCLIAAAFCGYAVYLYRGTNRNSANEKDAEKLAARLYTDQRRAKYKRERDRGAPDLTFEQIKELYYNTYIKSGKS